jgi:hypothetical protein
MWGRHTIFKSKTHEEDTYLLFIQIRSIAIYTGICAFVQSEKLTKILLFGPSLIHQLRLLGSQQHPQIWVLLTSFSTWGTENSPEEINLESTVCVCVCVCVCEIRVVTFFGSKIGKRSFVTGRIIVQHEKISRTERSWTNPLNALQEAICASFITFIYCFSLWYGFFVHYALRVKKVSTWS